MKRRFQRTDRQSAIQEALAEKDAAIERRIKAEKLTAALQEDQRHNGYAMLVLRAMGGLR